MLRGGLGPESVPCPAAPTGRDGNSAGKGAFRAVTVVWAWVSQGVWPGPRAGGADGCGGASTAAAPVVLSEKGRGRDDNTVAVGSGACACACLGSKWGLACLDVRGWRECRAINGLSGGRKAPATDPWKVGVPGCDGLQDDIWKIQAGEWHLQQTRSRAPLASHASRTRAVVVKVAVWPVRCVGWRGGREGREGTGERGEREGATGGIPAVGRKSR